MDKDLSKLCLASSVKELKRTSTPTPGAGTSASLTWARAHETSAPVLSRACSVVMERSAQLKLMEPAMGLEPTTT